MGKLVLTVDYLLGVNMGLTIDKVPVVTVETFRNDCFYSSMALNSNLAGSFGVPDEVDSMP